LSFKNRYGLVDRLVHRVAFATTWAQRGTADIEEKMFRRELDAIEMGAPVLITSLPRAGTTILLEVVASLRSFAAHTYRDMPFVLCPLLWDRISKPFQRDAELHERAHGDGIQLSSDSPEAFEEMIWKRFWPKHYRKAAIDPWQTCGDEEFVEFFASHMRKIIALRGRDKPTANRYVSKNNLNIARIPAVFSAVPNAIVVIPFRDPLQHAASLHRQHQRFLAMHREDSFARSYMAGVGHFDFGANLKPVNFGGWFDGREVGEAAQLSFWLDYWIASYRHVLEHSSHDQLHLVCFETLGTGPDLSPLGDSLKLCQADALQDAGTKLRPAKPHDVSQEGLDSRSLREALDIYEELKLGALI
jgi:hypothetical protein